MRLIDADALIEQMKENPPSYGDMDRVIHAVEDAPTVSGWISVEDRLPIMKGWYMVYAPSYSGGSSSGLAYHNGVMFSKWSGKSWSVEVGYHERPGCVKAWMPLPEPPKEDEK